MEKVQLEIEIKGSDSIGKASEKTKSLKTQLKELKTELQSGKLTGKAFDEVTLKAAKMQEQIDDVNQSVKALANDNIELAINGFNGLTQGIVGGFAAAQGAMALFGGENEDLQKQLIKLQGAIALLNGVESINLALKKESGLVTGLNVIKTNLLTFAQTRYTAAVAGTTGVLKTLRIVGMTLGIGLIVAAIGLLVANFDKVQAIGKKLIDRFNGLGTGMKTFISIVMPVVGLIRLLYAGLEKLGVFAETAADKLEKIEIASKKLNKQRERDIEKLEALGGAEDKIFLKRLAMLNQDKLILMQKKLLGEATDEEIEQINDLGNAIDILKIKEQQRLDKIKEEQTKEQKDRDKANRERLQKEIEAAKQREEKEEEEAKKKRQSLLKISQDQKERLELFKQEQDKLIEARILAEEELDKLNMKRDEEERQKQLEKDEQERQRIIDAAQFEIQAKQNLENAKLGIAEQGSQLLNAVAGKNKAIAMTALAIEKGAAIASVIVNTQREISAINANPTWTLLPDGGATIKTASIIAAKVKAGLNIATIAATGINNAKSIQGGGGVGGGVSAPNVNGVNTTNQRPQPIKQEPIKVYVTETDIRNTMRKVDDIYVQSVIR